MSVHVTAGVQVGAPVQLVWRPIGAWARGAVAGVAARLTTPALIATSSILYAIAQPPADMPHASWICLIPLLTAIRRCRSPRGAAFCSFGFGVLFSALVAGWLPGTIATFFQLTPAGGWLGALVVYALFAALPLALFGAVAHRPLRAGNALLVGVVVPVLWVATDLLRARVLGGLPWGLLGHALYRTPVLIQIADLAGVSGVSAVIAAMNAGIFLAVVGTSRGRRTLVPLAVAAGLVGVVGLYGRVRLTEVTLEAAGPGVAVGVLQPNQPPVFHWTRVAADRALATYVRLTQTSFASRRADLVIWPENAIPLYPAQDAATRAQLAGLADRLGVSLILGAPAAGGAGEGSYFNAAHLVVPGVGLAATYRKQRLVPFAEYRPLGGERSGAGEAPSFSPGERPIGFSAAGLHWGPTICLDLIYADVVRAGVLAGAEAIVNLSNDSWLAAGGRGAAEQQFAQAVFRAVENRRDVVRAATTGISAVVSATGLPSQMLAEGRAGAFLASVSGRRTLTMYTRYGDVFAAGCAALAAAIILHTGIAARRQRRRRCADA